MRTRWTNLITLLSAAMCLAVLALWFNSAGLSWFNLNCRVHDDLCFEAKAAHSTFIFGFALEDSREPQDATLGFTFRRISDDADFEAIGARMNASAHGVNVLGLGFWTKDDLRPIIAFCAIPYWLAAILFAVLPTRSLLRLPVRVRLMLVSAIVLGLSLIAVLLLLVNTYPIAYKDRVLIPPFAGVMWWATVVLISWHRSAHEARSRPPGVHDCSAT